MKIRQLASLAFVALGVAVLLAAVTGCGVSHSATPIAVQWDPNYSPPTSLITGDGVGVAAVVSNDPQNQGVKFTCAPAGSCGTFNPTQAGSTVPTCYLAPAQIPATNPLTITATSVSDATRFASAQITIQSGPGQGCP